MTIYFQFIASFVCKLSLISIALFVFPINTFDEFLFDFVRHKWTVYNVYLLPLCVFGGNIFKLICFLYQSSREKNYEIIESGRQKMEEREIWKNTHTLTYTKSMQMVDVVF